MGMMPCGGSGGSGSSSSTSVGTSDDAKSSTNAVLNMFDVMSNDHAPASESAKPPQQNLNTKLSSVGSLSSSLTATSTSSCSAGTTSTVWGSAQERIP